MSIRATSKEVDDSQQDVKPPAITWVNFHDSAEQDRLFNIPVGNVHLRVENRIFSIPRYRLAEFCTIKSRLSVQFHDQLVLEGSYIDFHNTFKILLAPVFSKSPSDFDTQVLISALRIATKFNHPQLRAFCIRNLELRKLPEMDYLPLARELGIPDWEKKAIDYLSARRESITVKEAQLLGTELFVSTAARREERVAREQSSKATPPVNPHFVFKVPKSTRTMSEEAVVDLPQSSVSRSRSGSAVPRGRKRPKVLDSSPEPPLPDVP
ncbi:hypothetical protein FS749_008413 [Ceratobasidium sp. UAMH 11750]|nr:hypothetical protein FS749_008413 [Ceratobasidium sp. UAMH 11750]